jgi:hypothetical protein
MLRVDARELVEFAILGTHGAGYSLSFEVGERVTVAGRTGVVIDLPGVGIHKVRVQFDDGTTGEYDTSQPEPRDE